MATKIPRGVPHAGADSRLLPVAIEEEFQKLMATNGRLFAEHIVETARDPKNPLHRMFTWDNNEAARKWRLKEARNLITSYEIYNETLNIKVRALSSLEADRLRGGGYRWTMEAMAVPTLREELLRTAFSELERFKGRYQQLEELAKVFEAIDEAEPK